MPGPARKAYCAPPDTLAGLRGGASWKGRQEEGMSEEQQSLPCCHIRFNKIFKLETAPFAIRAILEFTSFSDFPSSVT